VHYVFPVANHGDNYEGRAFKKLDERTQRLVKRYNEISANDENVEELDSNIESARRSIEQIQYDLQRAQNRGENVEGLTKLLADNQQRLANLENQRSKVDYSAPAYEVYEQSAATAGAAAGQTQDAIKQWREKGVESPYFKEWFGDSKVVDDEDKPLVVYHTTTMSSDSTESIPNPDYFTDDREQINAEINKASMDRMAKLHVLNKEEKELGGWAEIVKQGKDVEHLNRLKEIYRVLEEENKKITNKYGDRAFAAPYIRKPIELKEKHIRVFSRKKLGATGAISSYLGFWFSDMDLSPAKNGGIKVFLNIENPYITDNRELMEDLKYLSEQNNDNDKLAAKIFLDDLMEQGYDGIALDDYEYKRGDGKSPSRSFVAFYPNQIKSVENRGTFDVANPNIYYQTAFHGGAIKKINRFSNDFIGTGEGAAAFGWGHYFTSLKEIAEWYRKSITETNEISIDGKRVDYAFERDILREMYARYGNDIEKIRQNIARNLISGIYDDSLTEREVKAIYNKLEHAKNIEFKESSGQVYRVEIPNSDEFLQLDKTISQQSAKVRDAAIRINNEVPELKIQDNMAGAEFYASLENALGSDKASSLKLLEYGIKGNEFSTGNAKGRNFVVFDPALINIQETYYQAVSQSLNNIEPVKIEGNLPQFSNVRDLFRYIEDNLDVIGDFTIKETGQNISVTKSGVKRELKNRRKQANKNVYLKFREIFENSKYRGFIEPDRSGVLGQEVYVNKIEMPDGKVFDVEFRADILPDERLNFAGIKTKASGRDTGFTPLLTRGSNNIPQNGRNVNTPRARISFESERAIITLMKSHDKSSIVHELGHLFLKDIERISKISDDAGFAALKKKIDDYLHVEYDADGNALYNKAYAEGSGETSATPHEKFANSFTAFVRTGKAPNSALHRIFMMFRQWLMQIRDALVDSEAANLEASPEMHDVFSELLAPMDFERTSYNETERAQIEREISDIRAGKDIEVSGQRLDEIRNYVDQINRRRPKAPKDDLMYYIKRFGVKETFPLIDKAREAGIKVVKEGEEGYRVALGEDNLQRFLDGTGFLQASARDTELEGITSDDLHKRSLNLLERALDGEKIYSADNMAAVEAIEDYDRNIDAIDEMFGGNFDEAQRVLEAIDTLADKNFGVVSMDALERLRDLAARVAEQNEKLSKGEKIENIEREIVKEREIIRQKKMNVEALEKKTQAFNEEAERRYKLVGERINIKKAREAIAKANKQIEEDKQYIKDYTARLEQKEKALAQDKKLYGDIKEAIDRLAERNKDLGKRINKKDIDDAIKQRDREKLLAAVNDAMAEVENYLEGTPEYAFEQIKYANPYDIINLKAKTLLETAKQRAEDKKDATGFRAALRSFMSGIPHFSNIRLNKAYDENSKTKTAKEQHLEKWQTISSWQDLIDNFDMIVQGVKFDASVEYQKFIDEAIKKEISKNIWVKRGSMKIGRYDGYTNEWYKRLQQILNEDPQELAKQLNFTDTADTQFEEHIDYLKRIENQLIQYLLAPQYMSNGKKNIMAASLYKELADIRKEANRGVSLKQLEDRKNFTEEIEALSRGILSGDKAKGVNPFTKIFTQIEGNLESVLNLLFGKDAVDTYSLLDNQTLARIDAQNKIKDLFAAADLIFGGNGKDESFSKFINAYKEMMSREDMHLYSYIDYKHPSGKPKTVHLSKAEILNFYIGYKQPDIMKRLLYQFEEPRFNEKGEQIAPIPSNIKDMFNKLTPQEKALGDLFQKTAQEPYESVNEVKFRLTGLLLGERENYFPSIAGSREEISNLEIAMQVIQAIKNPSFVKERVESDKIRQIPVDPLSVLIKHLQASSYYVFNQEANIRLRKIAKSAMLGDAIKNAGTKDNYYLDVAKNAVLPRTAKTTSEAEETAKEKANKKPINTLLKIAGFISNANLRKMNEEKAVKKSVSPAAHAHALVNIDKLFERALFEVTHGDQNNDVNIEEIRRLGAVMEFEGKYYPVKLTVKKFVDENIGNSVYSVEAMEIEEARKVVSPEPDNAADARTSAIAGFNRKITEIIDNVNNAVAIDKKSKTNKPFFGTGIYKKLRNTVDMNSLPKQIERLTEIEGTFNKLANNFLKSAIAIKPQIALKQIVAFVNYSEGLPKGEFVKGIAEFAANPKKAYDFMMQDPFLQARYSGGTMNETIANALNADNFSQFSKWSKWLTVNIRIGDAISVCAGGYARIKYLMSQGMSKEDAFKDFRLATQRTQQSGETAAIAEWQASKHIIIKMIGAFRNAQGQYARKIVDAYVQFRRGEITAAKFAEVGAIYLFYNSIIYSVLTYGITGFFDDDDKDEDITNLIVSPFTSFFGAVPFLDDASNLIAQLATGGNTAKIGNAEVFGVQDFFDWFKKINKLVRDDEVRTSFDAWINTLDFPTKAATGVPVETIFNMFAGVIDLFNEGDRIRGALRAAGYSKYRANMIANGRYIKE